MCKVCASARTRSMIYGSMPSEKLTIFQTAFVMQVNIQILCILFRRMSAEDTSYACCRTFG
ncbi:hemagglutinin [Neisseria sp. N95_16]|uniref:Hemagglutinin n=1 Tax=Neisseria brasiliensis TaxID=2666100 RepID=A0A7X2KXX7_9NEIS|nr:hemagglutinin [Neisseria brasiliensis]PJO08559.1 hemagglutinin [Neisseria sp. N95_16]